MNLACVWKEGLDKTGRTNRIARWRISDNQHMVSIMREDELTWPVQGIPSPVVRQAVLISSPHAKGFAQSLHTATLSYQGPHAQTKPPTGTS